MSVSTTIDKITVNVKLNNETSGGIVQTLTVPLNGFDTLNYDDQKAMNIINLLGDCLSKPVYTIEKAVIHTLIEE